MSDRPKLIFANNQPKLRFANNQPKLRFDITQTQVIVQTGIPYLIPHLIP